MLLSQPRLQLMIRQTQKFWLMSLHCLMRILFTIDLVNRDKLIELQQNDSSLQSLFALCDQDNSDYLLQSGVLGRVYRDSVSPPDAAVHQIVVPVVLRSRLLQIAHDIPAAAHLGVAKTTARCLLYTSPSPRDGLLSRMPSSA